MFAFVLTGLTTLALLQWAAVRRGREPPTAELECWIVESTSAARASAPTVHADRRANRLLEDSSFESQGAGALGGASIEARLPAKLAADFCVPSTPGGERASRPIVVPHEILEQVDAALDRRPRPVAPVPDADRGGESPGSAVTLH